jgi:hypothetical protein
MKRLLAVLVLLAGSPALLHAQADEQLRQAVRRYENLEIERARALFEQVISPTTPFPVTEAQRVVAYKYLGATLATLGRRDTAITFFVAAIGRDPLVDLDPRAFGEQERQVFQEARGRVFRLGMRAIPRDTIDPRSERVNFTIASTHNGLVRVELVSTFDDARYTLFEGDVDGPRDIPFNGLSPRGGGLIPPGAYDLVVTGESRTRAQQADSTSNLLEIGWDRAALEDTIAAFGPNDVLLTRQPSSVATKDLLKGVGIAAGAIISAQLIGQSQLEGRTALASGVAVVGVGSGLYAFLHRRNHPEIPENIVENAARVERRAAANSRIMERNTARIDATKIIIRPLGQ